MSQIQINHITKQYGTGASAFVAVRDVSLEVKSGELFFLLGPSGCGKTTLLRIIAGLIQPTHGNILLGDHDATHFPPQKRNTAMVFQNYALWPHMSVYQNVEFGPRVQGVGKSERRKNAHRILELVKIGNLGMRKPNQISGGQQQRVALARALAANADCLLLDEPLSNLDAQLRLLMRTELRQIIKATKSTAVYVTHDQKEAMSMADRIAVMKNGQIMQVGTPETLYNYPSSRFVAGFLGEVNFIDGELIAFGDTCEVRTSAGCLRAVVKETEGNFSRGQTVTCCIRPEHMILSKNQSSDSDLCSLQAVVTSHSFLGDIRQYSCSLVDNSMWRITAIGDVRDSYSIGEKVYLAMNPENVRILPASTSIE